jgi:RNA polymerase sporulation-specific sigma factor
VLSDDELVMRFQKGQERAFDTLVHRYRRLIRAKQRAFFLVGADADDLEQEALVGLFKAARDFRSGDRHSFALFAQLCITRQVVTAVKMATRRKHQPLNQSVYISPSPSGFHDTDRADRLCGADHRADPATRVESTDLLGAASRRVKELLTSLEADVVSLHVAGYSYQEISQRLRCHVKAVDNSLQRAKRKLRPHIDEIAA